MPADTQTPHPVQLTAADGYRLQALRYPYEGPFKGHLILAGATGVPQGHYKRFSQYAATQGFDVWTLDYRGIGMSKPASLREFKMNYLDWARLDLAALLSHVAGLGPSPIMMVGHSYGGHAFGMLPGRERVQRFATFGTGAGWHGWMPRLESLRVLFMWHVLGPLIVWTKGYLAWSLLGMGEDLPRDVFRQWRRWCRWPRYFFDDPELPHLAAEFSKVDIPIRAINARDDKWASPESRDAFMSAYQSARLDAITVEPARLGMKTIGHMGYFRPQAEVLWKETLEWLTEQDKHPLSANHPAPTHTGIQL
jgi:predicted alpha/beta hydrolase